MKLRQILSKSSAEKALVAGICVAAATGAAVAGTDSTFTTTVTSLTGWANGSLGKLAAVAGIGSALVGMVLKFDWKLIGGALGIGLYDGTRIMPTVTGVARWNWPPHQ